MNEGKYGKKPILMFCLLHKQNVT